MKKYKEILGLVVCTVFFAATMAKADNVPATQAKYLMGAMGDSMTAASFANTDLGQARSAGNVTGLYENKDTFSWATGKEIKSNYMQLASFYKNQSGAPDVEYMNVAVPGAQTTGMPEQAQKLVDAMKSGKYSDLVYVTFLIGANDSCNDSWPEGTPVDKFKENVKAAFAKLAEIQQTQKVRILVGGIPKVAEVGKPEILKLKSFAGMSCNAILNKVMKYCPKMTSWKTDDDYRRLVGYIKDKNAVLKAAVDEASTEFKTLDIHFANPIFDMEIAADILAADCFHPNKNGQELMSQILWYEQPWFK